MKKLIGVYEIDAPNCCNSKMTLISSYCVGVDKTHVFQCPLCGLIIKGYEE
jgi:hypothetical protein